MRTVRALLGSALLAATLVGTGSATPAEAATPLWSVTNLRPLSSEPSSTAVVNDINNAGISVGYTRAGAFDPQAPGAVVPTRWDQNGNPTALAIPPGCEGGEARSIDDPGVIVGMLHCSGMSFPAIEWFPNGSYLRLGTSLIPEDINDHGISVGEAEGGSFGLASAYALAPPQPRLDLPDGGQVSFARAVTNWGYVVGAVATGSSDPDRTTIATGWYGNEHFPLDDLPYSSQAVDVNERGNALIKIWWPGGVHGAIVEPGGRLTHLDRGTGNDELVAINRWNTVVGARSVGYSYVGMLFAFGTAIRLDSLVSAANRQYFVFDHASSLNDSAWIVGTGPYGRAWLMKPPG